MGKLETADLSNGAKDLAQEVKTNPWFSGLARLGYAVRGILYALIGYLAISLIFTGRGQITDTQGALATIAAQPFGGFLLVVIAIGMGGLALWMIVLAVADPYHKGQNAAGRLARAGYLVTGFSYGMLIVPVFRMIIRAPSSQKADAEEVAEQAAAGIFQLAWGPWLVGALGLVVMGVGFARIYNGWQANFDEKFKTYKLSAKQKAWSIRMGRIGTAAMGIVMVIMGLLAVLAAQTLDPQKVGGVDSALIFLIRQPYGPWLLSIVSLGFIAYAAYSFLGAIWFQISEL